MELQVILDNYEAEIRVVSEISSGDRRMRRERKIWNIYRFLIKCGVDKRELEVIEEKYDY